MHIFTKTVMQKCFSKWVLLKNSGNSQKTPELEFHLDKFGGREYKLDKRSGWGTKAALASALVGYELYSSGSLQGKTLCKFTTFKVSLGFKRFEQR